MGQWIRLSLALLLTASWRGATGYALAPRAAPSSFLRGLETSWRGVGMKESMVASSSMRRGSPIVRCTPTAHMGHSHSHHHHHHQHETKKGGAVSAGKFVKVGKLKIAKSTLRSVVIVALASLMLFPRGIEARFKFGMMLLVGSFLLVVEQGKSVVGELKWKMSSLRRAFKQHQPQEGGAGIEGAAIDAKRRADAMAANRITWVGVVVNLFLAAFKLVAGIVGNSAAMIADAGHSLSDLLSDGVTLWAVRLARLPPDEDHPYGHGRFEAVGALLIAILLGSAAVGFGRHAYDGLAHAMGAAMAAGGTTAAATGHVHGLMTGVPGSIALAAAVISIVSKEVLFRATAAVGNKLNSQVLLANAWHHRSDALSSIVALVGIAGARVGFPLLDPIAGLCVAAMVALTGVQLGWEAMKELTDTVDDAVVIRVAELSRQVKGVVAVDPKKVRARRMGSDTLVDLRVQTPSYMSASGANQVAETVRWRILESMPEVKEVLVHVTSEPKQCPMLASLRSAEAIEADVRAKLRALACSKPLPGDYVGDKKITTVHKVTVHYLDMQPCVEVLVEVPEFLSVKEAKQLAMQARDAIEALEDVSRAEVHLSLATSQQVPSLKEIYMLSDETAPVFSDEPSSPVFISAGPKREFA